MPNPNHEKPHRLHWSIHHIDGEAPLPVVLIDIGKGNKPLRMTVEQLAQDGLVLTRQRVALTYGGDDDLARPSPRQMEDFLGSSER